MASPLEILTVLKDRVVAVTAALAAAGNPRTVIIGWPSRNQLQELMQRPPEGKGHVVLSIYMPEGMERDITIYGSEPQMVTCPTSKGYWNTPGTKKVVIRLGDDVTASSILASEASGGVFIVGEVFAVVIKRWGSLQGDLIVGHPVVAGDDASSIAADLKVKIDALGYTGLTVMANAVPGQLEFTYDADANTDDFEFVTIELRIGAKVVLISEVSRKQRFFWVNVWAPSPTKRDLFAGVLQDDFGLFENYGSPLGVFNRILLPNGLYANIYNGGFSISDEEIAQKIFRGWFTLHTEFAVTVEVEATQIVGTQTGITILYPPGVTGGPGLVQANVPPSLICRNLQANPWMKEQLDKLTIFNTGCDI